MRAGRLRHRLELYSKDNSTRDAYGAALTTITLEATVWGAVEPLRGRELFAQAQVKSEVETRVVLRYNGNLDLDTAWVIKHPLTGKYYDVLDVINPGTRNREWELMCRQGLSEDRYSVTVVVSGYDDLLLETGDFLLLETGDNLLLEA